MRQEYKQINFRDEAFDVLKLVNNIVSNYAKAGYRLTARQIYYQFVALDWFPDDRRWKWNGSKWVRDANGTKNADPNYKWLCALINDGKLAGYIDWDAIEDRMREFITRPHWSGAVSMMGSIEPQFHMDMWESQPNRVFVIIEKDALAGVLEATCREYDMPLLAARGYPSGTVLREFAHRDLMPAMAEGQNPVILHLGDHDPSGIDMSRDLEDRLNMFAETNEDWGFEFKRIALNWDQIQQQKPPPNPAKLTDPRAGSYRSKHGDESWELDALKPEFMNALLAEHVEALIDEQTWTDRKAAIEVERAKLTEARKGMAA